MIDFIALKVIWWLIIGLVLVTYATTAGFDAGVTIIMPFLKDEEERRVLLNVSAPTWDGNLSWIVFAGGGLFVVWPPVYSMAFSGLYFAILLILWSFFLRPPGYEYRNKIPSHTWRRTWDWALFISGALPVFIFGVAMGNCFLGFPFYFDPQTLRQFYTGSFWQLLSPFAILAGLNAVFMVIMHGAAYLQRRTEGEMRDFGRKIHAIFGTLLLIGFSIAGLLLLFTIDGYRLISQASDPTLYPLNNVVTEQLGGWVTSYEQYPWKAFAPFATYAGLVVSLWANYMRKVRLAFWASAFAIAGIIGTAGFSLFPFLMPSSTNPDQSLTIWNAVSSQYSLNVMFYVGVVLLMIIAVYKIFAYNSVWGKQPTISVADVHKNEHIFY